jgi:hypothetical protein
MPSVRRRLRAPRAPSGRWLAGVLLLLVALAATVGCERADFYDRPLEMEGAFVLNGSYVTWDTAREQYLRLELPRRLDDRVKQHYVTVAGSDHRVQRSVDGDELLILSPSTRSLAVIAESGAEGGRHYDLGQPFDQLALSDDARFAVAYAGGARQPGTTVAVSQNLIAVVDLTRPPAASDAAQPNPRVQSVSSFGGARLGVEVSPEFDAGGVPRRMAVVRSVGHVALFDLLEPTHPPIAVPLVVPGDPVDLRPTLTRFRARTTGHGGLMVFLAAEGSGDVIELRLETHAEADPTGPLAARLNQHPVGGRVSAMEPVTMADGSLHVLALSSQARRVVLVDVATGGGVQFELDTAYSTFHLFELADGAGGVLVHALFQAPNTRNLAILAVDDVPAIGAKALKRRVLRVPYTSIEPVPGSERFVAFERAETSSRGLTLGWLGREAAEESVLIGGTFVAHLITEDGFLLILADVAGTQYLVSIDTVSGLPQELVLDTRATRIDLVPDTGFVVVTHDTPGGLLTLVDPAAFRRADTARFHGFLLDGLFGE